DLVRGRGELDHGGDAALEVQRVLARPDVHHHRDLERRLVEHALDPVLSEVRAHEIPQLQKPLRLRRAAVAKIPGPIARLAADETVTAPDRGGDVEACDEGAAHCHGSMNSVASP